MELASLLPWRIALILAPLSAGILHVLAAVSALPKSAPDISALGSVLARGIWSNVFTALQFVIPVAFVVGAVVSYRRGAEAKTLFGNAQTHGSSAVRQMSWREFERLVAEAFRRRGYAVCETGRRGADGGVDLVLSKDGERTLVQCKHWRTQRVGVTVIRELYGVMAANGATGGYVVTSGTFTQEAWHFAQTCRIELLDGDGLEALVREVERKRAREVDPVISNAAGPDKTTPAITPPCCPACGSSMTKRVARRGRNAGESFWGCSQYPDCRGT